MRKFLIGGMLLLSVSTLSFADTVVDVFDESLESQIMKTSAADIDNELPEPMQFEAGSDKRPVGKFRLASFRISSRPLETYDHWAPGKYPPSFLSNTGSIVSTNQNEYFFYFAADIPETIVDATVYGIENSVRESNADHHLKKLPRNLTRSAKR